MYQICLLSYLFKLLTNRNRTFKSDHNPYEQCRPWSTKIHLLIPCLRRPKISGPIFPLYDVALRFLLYKFCISRVQVFFNKDCEEDSQFASKIY